MNPFKETYHLSEVLEASNKSPLIIFKFSSECNSSSRLKGQFEKEIEEKKITQPIYLVVVQKQRALSRKIEEYFEIKHESPQIIILSKGKAIYTANHFNIKTENFVFG